MNGKRTARIVLACLTSVIILALFAVFALVRPPQMFVDHASAETDASRHTVRQSTIESYCPSHMVLSDATQYGDSEFQVSAGNQSTVTRYAAFGTVYVATVKDFGASGAEGSTLASNDGQDDAAMIGAGEKAERSGLLRSSLLKASNGTGQAGAVASEATEGDLRGVSAASCVTPELEQSFLVSGTTTGLSQQLVIANPSSKATSVTLQVRGSQQPGTMQLSIGGTVAVAAGGESVVDLSAAVSGQQALYVTITSAQTPVAAVVRAVASSGLTPKGNDFSMPLASAGPTVEIPSVREGDAVSVLAYARDGAKARLSWITDDGLESIGDKDIPADTASSFDLGKAPKGALGVLLTTDGDGELSASAVLKRSGGAGQEDFALVGATRPSRFSAVALPAGYEATVTLINVTTSAQQATIALFDDTGSRSERRTVTVKANSAMTIDAKDAAAVRVRDTKDSISWGVRLSSPKVDEAKLAGLSSLDPTPLTPRRETVWVSHGQQVVR